MFYIDLQEKKKKPHGMLFDLWFHDRDSKSQENQKSSKKTSIEHSEHLMFNLGFILAENRMPFESWFYGYDKIWEAKGEEEYTIIEYFLALKVKLCVISPMTPYWYYFQKFNKKNLSILGKHLKRRIFCFQ